MSTIDNPTTWPDLIEGISRGLNRVTDDLHGLEEAVGKLISEGETSIDGHALSCLQFLDRGTQVINQLSTMLSAAAKSAPDATAPSPASLLDKRMLQEVSDLFDADAKPMEPAAGAMDLL